MKKKLVGIISAMMVLAMGTTVFADPSRELGGGEASGATVESYTAAFETPAAAEAAITALDNSVGADNVTAVVSFTKPTKKLDNGNYEITYTNTQFKSGEAYDVLHYVKGAWVVIAKGVAVSNGSVTFQTDSCSPFAFVKSGAASTVKTDDKLVGANTSPKTGSALPILPVLAIACLAGVVVCGKKVKFNA